MSRVTYARFWSSSSGRSRRGAHNFVPILRSSISFSREDAAKERKSTRSLKPTTHFPNKPDPVFADEAPGPTSTYWHRPISCSTPRDRNPSDVSLPSFPCAPNFLVHHDDLRGLQF
jgi:hypothetical protein